MCNSTVQHTLQIVTNLHKTDNVGYSKSALDTSLTDMFSGYYWQHHAKAHYQELNTITVVFKLLIPIELLLSFPLVRHLHCHYQFQSNCSHDQFLYLF